MVTMFGCCSPPTARNARNARVRSPASSSISSRLIATSRSRTGSRPRYTVPCPPSAMTPRISYRPMRGGTMRRDYSDPRDSQTSSTPRLQTFDLRLSTADLRLQTFDLRLPTSDFRLKTSDLRLPTYVEA